MLAGWHVRTLARWNVGRLPLLTRHSLFTILRCGSIRLTPSSAPHPQPLPDYSCVLAFNRDARVAFIMHNGTLITRRQRELVRSMSAQSAASAIVSMERNETFHRAHLQTDFGLTWLRELGTIYWRRLKKQYTTGQASIWMNVFLHFPPVKHFSTPATEAQSIGRHVGSV